PRISMTEREAALMAKYGIVAETKTIYRYGPYQYGNLSDALNYAALTEARDSVPPAHTSTTAKP
ncbi:MAG: hypothetical protein RIE74_05260, partial [Pseudomonadales bacterium]